jgi:hypothetical protein
MSETDHDDWTGQATLPDVIELDDGTFIKTGDATTRQLIAFARVLAVRALRLSALAVAAAERQRNGVLGAVCAGHRG